MAATTRISDRIFSIANVSDFNSLAIELFNLHFSSSPVYRSFCQHLHVKPSAVKHYIEIPFLPVEFFKTHRILPENLVSHLAFSSSGTTNTQTSYHHIVDIELYIESFTRAFTMFYGPVTDFCILALLPSYLERSGSSLVFMVEHLMAAGKHPDSGFYLHDRHALAQQLQLMKAKKQKTLLMGVSYALLDMAEEFPMSFPELIVMETGGMKGQRKELIRNELHQILQQGFEVDAIHSEYGMTELLSQAYSEGSGRFFCPPWMKILIRDTNDPLSLVKEGKSGGINIIDLANLNSCPFIAVQDLGKLHSDGSFEVLGRFDNSQVRGCNLLIH